MQSSTGKFYETINQHVSHWTLRTYELRTLNYELGMCRGFVRNKRVYNGQKIKAFVSNIQKINIEK